MDGRSGFSARVLPQVRSAALTRQFDLLLTLCKTGLLFVA